MLFHRVIPCLDVARGRVVKGTRFVDLRDAGDPAELARRYAEAGADEIVFLDIAATPDEQATLLEAVERTARQAFVPLTVGGGVRSPRDMRATLRAGADRVSVNTAAVRDPGLIDRCAREFGRQCVVVAIDAHAVSGDAGGGRPGRWEVVVRGGREATGIDAVAWAAEAAERGAGELLVTSIDRDGTHHGYDLALLRAITSAVEVPVIASGGAGTPDDLVAAIADGGASAVLAASIFHDDVHSIGDVKRAMAAAGIRVRLVDGDGSAARADRRAGADGTRHATRHGATERPTSGRSRRNGPPDDTAPDDPARGAPLSRDAAHPMVGRVRWDSAGLVPGIVQDASDGTVLMLGYLDADALEATLDSGFAHFHSRSRGRLWKKGESSGNVLAVRDLRLDCDGDAILMTADPAGPTCHTGRRSCFDGEDHVLARDVARSGAVAGRPPGAVPAPGDASLLAAAPRSGGASSRADASGPGEGFQWLERLWTTIESRAAERPAGSYTVRLLDGGVDAAARKVTEEATEVLIAAKDDAAAETLVTGRGTAAYGPRPTQLRLAEEAADLLYHVLVLSAERGVRPASVIDVLRARHGREHRGQVPGG